MTLSVIIITLQRHRELKRCLECLSELQPLPDQVIVVDSSDNDLSRRVVEAMEEHRVLDVVYVRNDEGHSMTRSRNMGLMHAKGDIIAFLDDDAFAHAGWSSELLATYQNEDNVAAVGGRALNNVAGEEKEGVERIGHMDSNGVLHGYFAADSGKILEVKHLIGCNMSFQRDVLARLGGFSEGYPGTAVREETEMYLRIARLGGRILFNPRAVVTHVGAPQVVGRRFDLRYEYYQQHNHLVMLISNFGLSSVILRRYLVASTRSFIQRFPQRLFRRERHPIVIVASVGVYFAATVCGLISGIRRLKRRGLSPMRHDEQGQKIRDVLMQTPLSTTAQK